MSIHNFCDVHFSGTMDTPCAWPGCPKGHADDVYHSALFSLEKEFKRDSFTAADGNPRFFWISESESYGWVIENVIRNELQRLAHKDVTAIYHYTSLEGFQGIIDSSDLWLTESAFLNDASEVAHGIDISREIFNRLEIESSPIKDYLREVIEAKNERQPRINIACFSSARDSLSQWRAYGGNVGVSISFDPKSLLRSLGYPDCKLGHVLYDDEKKRSLLETYLLFQVEAYRRDSKRTIKVLRRDLTTKTHLPITGYDSSLSYLYFELVTSCKHSDFNDEHEVRLFYTEHSSVLNSFRLKPATTRFRKGNGYLAPYTTIEDIRIAGRRNFKREQLPITEVMIAPHPRAELAALSVRRFLDHHGYNNVSVVTSKSPYR